MSSDVVSFSNPTDCFTAQTTLDVLGNGFMNPDVGGFAVGVASTFCFKTNDEKYKITDVCQISS